MKKAFQFAIVAGCLLGNNSFANENTNNQLYFSNGINTYLPHAKHPQMLAQRILDKTLAKLEVYRGNVAIINHQEVSMPIKIGGLYLLNDDVIQTGKASKAFIKVNQQTEVLLGELTRVVITYRKKRIFLKLIEGNCYLKTKEGPSDFRVFMETNELMGELADEDMVVSANATGTNTIMMRRSWNPSLQKDLSRSHQIKEKGTLYCVNTKMESGNIMPYQENMINEELDWSFTSDEKRNHIELLQQNLSQMNISAQDKINQLNAQEKEIPVAEITKAQKMMFSQSSTFTEEEKNKITYALLRQLKPVGAIVKKDADATPEPVEETEKSLMLLEMKKQKLKEAERLKQLEVKLLQEAEALEKQD